MKNIENKKSVLPMTSALYQMARTKLFQDIVTIIEKIKNNPFISYRDVQRKIVANKAERSSSRVHVS